MAAKKEPKKVENTKVDKVPATMKVLLKSNYKDVDKEGKVTKHKPDETITVSGLIGLKLIANAKAVKA